MSPNARKLLAAVTTAGILGMSLTQNPTSHAFDFGDMMKPGKWMGDGRNRNGDYYDRPYRGPRGAPYGGGPWGRPWGGGYWPGPYGTAPYGAGPHGVPRYRGTAPPAQAMPTAKAPSQATTGSNEIDELKRRIKELESQQRTASSPSTDQGARCRRRTAGTAHRSSGRWTKSSEPSRDLNGGRSKTSATRCLACSHS